MTTRRLNPCRTLAAIGLSLALIPLAACSIVESENRVSFSGNYVPADSFSRVVVGESTPAFVEATLGEPSARTALEDGAEIWRWDYVVNSSGSGRLLLVFDGRSSSQKKRAAYVQFADGVVSRKWRD
jgi:outer membrane protein assembly factor BamE (lipoprotein component of BamABCDE complex)